MTQQQLDRLVNQEYPWLWGIRQHWSVIHNEIKVVTVHRRPSFLRQIATPPGSEFEVWCKTRWEGTPGDVAVYRVTDERPYGGGRWGEVIHFNLRAGWALDAVITVGKTRCGCARVTIYRSPKKSVPLGDLL